MTISIFVKHLTKNFYLCKQKILSVSVCSIIYPKNILTIGSKCYYLPFGLVWQSLTQFLSFLSDPIFTRLKKIKFCTFYLSGLGSIVYDVCSPCLPQYTALVPIGCHFSFSWNDIFLSVPFVLRYLPENCQCWLVTHCKYTISYSKVQINVQECMLFFSNNNFTLRTLN